MGSCRPLEAKLVASSIFGRLPIVVETGLLHGPHCKWETATQRETGLKSSGHGSNKQQTTCIPTCLKFFPSVQCCNIPKDPLPLQISTENVTVLRTRHPPVPPCSHPPLQNLHPVPNHRPASPFQPDPITASPHPKPRPRRRRTPSLSCLSRPRRHRSQIQRTRLISHSFTDQS